MKDRVLSLSGEWKIEYLSPEEYRSEKEPRLTSDAITVKNAVPNYFEDMEDVFASAPFSKRIAINPLYKRQTYPETGYCEDTVLPSYLGSFAYQRSFELSEISDDCRIYFGGVQNTVSVWLNGIYIGRHEGYSADFEMDIPSGIAKTGENEITLAVSNNRLSGYMGRPVSGLTSRAANECTGGIYGEVELRISYSGIRDAWVTVANDLSVFTVNVEADTKRCYTVEIYDGCRLIDKKALQNGQSSVSFDASALRRWTHSDPKLYEAKIYSAEGMILRKFGIRRLEVLGTKLYFNGSPYFFRGFCEHCYHPITVHPTRDENYYRGVIRKAKELGFNSIRFHTYVPPMEYMSAADKEGILIEVETPNNTSIEEWAEIVRMTRRYTSVVAYSSGNEMVIDEDYIEHLRQAAELVHLTTDSLFSPMSAMRGIEYHSYGDCEVDEPIKHNPKRLAALSEFCDIYNSYSLGLTSYNSVTGDREILDRRNSIYKKPLLSHEICIHGTYCDLSVAKRYEGTRIGRTEMFSSVEAHLSSVGLIDRAELYYKNSVEWQKLLRKHCFETVRSCESFAGYDFLGDIDTHWHTFGYCVGLMNEFYEIKPGESARNVLKYNSDRVLLADIKNRVFKSGDEAEIGIMISNYGEDIENGVLSIALSTPDETVFENEYEVENATSGEITRLADIKIAFPSYDEPRALKLTATICGTENEWDIYAFPAPSAKLEKHPVTVSRGMSEAELIERLGNGERVLIFGSAPFEYEGTSFQISLAGRTNGHLATVINPHPLTEKIPEAFIGWQMAELLNGGKSVILDNPALPFEPIIEIATSYKNAHREALLFEYKVGKGKLLVCSLNVNKNLLESNWLKREIENYAASEKFDPKISITPEELSSIINHKIKKSEENTNLAFNKHDITAN